jgi:glycosyltransferase involved in cell wall biosynthesis
MGPDCPPHRGFLRRPGGFFGLSLVISVGGGLDSFRERLSIFRFLGVVALRHVSSAFLPYFQPKGDPMDAGVLQLHVFEHDPAYEPMRLETGETIDPKLTRASPCERSVPVSLIVPTFYNGTLKAASLTHLLAGIGDCRSIDEVVLVAADGDTQSLQKYTENTPVSVVVTACEPNRRAQARNVGVRAAKNDMLVFLDDDMLVQDWRLVDVILSELIAGSFDTALFPRRNYAKFPLLYEASKLGELIVSWRTGASDFPESDFLDPVRDGSPFKTMAFCFPGCFMMISREAYDRIGGFPEEFEGWGFEDSDFAMRAVRQLRVLNLFRATPALLHIDHPVSPYKSDEYRKNLKQFFSDYNSLDMDWLCRQVFEGENFAPERHLAPTSSDYLAPIQAVLQDYDLPVSNHAVIRNYQHVLALRNKRGLDPIPSYIALTGSRGTDSHQPDSDFDLITLFRGGAYAEHFVAHADGRSVEIESASLGKFEEMAAAPAAHATRGPLELAKLAQAKLLWGDSEAFDNWRSQVLGIALRVGLPVWLLYGIGMRSSPAKYGPAVELYFDAVQKIIGNQSREPVEAIVASAATMQDVSEPTGMPLSPSAGGTCDYSEFDSSLFEPDCFERLKTATRDLLDRDLDEWRIDMGDHKRVFAVQVPEIWRALNLLYAQD